MTYEEELKVQGLTEMVISERKKNTMLKAEIEFLNHPRLSEYYGLYEQIEEQQKIIDDQQETIENQKKSLREVFFRRGSKEMEE